MIKMCEYSENGIKYFGFSSVYNGQSVHIGKYSEFRNFAEFASEFNDGEDIEISYFRKLAPEWAFLVGESNQLGGGV